MLSLTSACRRNTKSNQLSESGTHGDCAQVLQFPPLSQSNRSPSANRPRYIRQQEASNEIGKTDHTATASSTCLENLHQPLGRGNPDVCNCACILCQAASMQYSEIEILSRIHITPGGIQKHAFLL